jgi:hypothetical protein
MREAGNRVEGRESEAVEIDILAIGGRDALNRIGRATWTGDAVRECEWVGTMEVERVAGD